MQTPAENARAKSRHKAIAGVLAAVILFAAIFTIGVSFFLFVSQSVHSADQADVARANNQLEAGQEKLLVTAGNTSGTDPSCQYCMWVEANNTGGVSSSIIDLYVTCMSKCGSQPQGQLLSDATTPPGSHFLKQNPDLSVTLPITLGVGASTMHRLSISKTAFDYLTGEYVVVSLLTSLGNVFSAQYPAPPNAVTNYTTVKSVSTQSVLTQIGGGPQLSLMMQATPTQTLSCSSGCITLTATVYNQAPWTATGVSISLNAPSASGTASASASSPCSPASQDIANGSSGSFTCTFSASTGAVGGFVSFSGHAAGTLNGVLVTSADSLSNSVEVGGIASVTTQGAFAANFFILKYSSCTQSSAAQHSFVGPCVPNASPMTLSNLPSGSFLAGGSNYYTAFYVQITNVFNTTLPIMQYSYLFGDPDISGELFYFLAGSNTSMTGGVYYPNYAANPPTLVGYPTDCNTVNSNNRPTDSNCIYVNPGQTVTLTIAACGYGATNWAWGGQQDASSFDSSSGCTMSSPSLSVPEGTSLGIIVAFAYKGNIYSQLMPFEGQALLRSTLTAVSCSPSPVSLSGSTTCTATVTDTDGGTFAYGSTGTVTFSATTGGSLGGFNPVSCTLASQSCSVTFSPNHSGVGSVTIQASYGGDSYHIASSGSTTVSIFYPTTTTVTCTPISFDAGTTSQCMATLTGFGGSVAGEPITWSQSGGTGSVSFSPTSCSLSAGGTCSVTVTGTGAGSATIKASYAGDAYNGASSGTTAVTVNPALSAGAITPSAPAIDSGQSITLTSHASGGTTPYSYQWYTGASCTSPISGATSSTYSPSPTTTTTYYYKVTDSAYSPASQCSAGDTVTVNAALSAGAITPSAPKIDSGQSITLTANPSGGTTPYSYQWYTGASCTTAISGATAATYSASPTTTTTYYYKVTDSSSAGAQSACSAGDTVTVNSQFTGTTVTITPATSTIDSGQSVTLTVTWTAVGTSPYSVTLYSGSSTTCSSDTTVVSTQSGLTTTSTTFTESPTAGIYYCATVTDGAYSPESISTATPAHVIVNPALAITTFSANPTAITSGGSSTITVSWSGGTSSYSVTLYSGSSATCSSDTTVVSTQSGLTTTSTTFTVSPTASIYYCAKVTDAAGGAVSSSTVHITVKGFDSACIPTAYGHTTTSTSISVTLPSCQAGDLIIVEITANSASTTLVTGISDSAGLTWQSASSPRGSTTGTGESIYEYSAYTSTALTNDVITVTVSNPGGNHHTYDLEAYGFTGVLQSSNFDTHAGLPYHNSGTASAPSVGSVSTSNAYDIIIALEGDATTTAQTLGIGFTLITSQSGNSQGISAEYKIVNTVQSSITVSFGTSTTNWDMLVDAIDPPQATYAATAAPTAPTSAVPGHATAANSVAGLGSQPSVFGILAAVGFVRVEPASHLSEQVRPKSGEGDVSVDE